MPPPTEVVEGKDPVEGPVGSASPPPSVEAANDDFIDTGFDNERLIEEPVTGGSDSSLWECEPGDSQCGPNGD